MSNNGQDTNLQQELHCLLVYQGVLEEAFCRKEDVALDAFSSLLLAPSVFGLWDRLLSVSSRRRQLVSLDSILRFLCHTGTESVAERRSKASKVQPASTVVIEIVM